MNTSRELKLINKEVEAHCASVLADFYKNNLIPAEKKSYLSRLADSTGPYMAISAKGNSPHYLLDAASQIATLGLGFNPAPFFGVATHQEAWTNDTQSEVAAQAIKALTSFFKRKTQWNDLHLALAHSGAEANELALGEAFQQRARPGARKVLAFEGSFHGRMMITLSSTWNKSKREPFEWPGFETIYSPFPDDESAQINAASPKNWQAQWATSNLSASEYKKLWKVEIAKSPLIEREIDVLIGVREKLQSGEVFALIVEPMQCEGGDRYGSARFFNALTLLCRAHEVAIVYDEVQTGFHLGRDFFWHRTFNLKDEKGAELLPNFVTCAKKAQMGMVISPRSISLYHHPKNSQEYQVAGLLRGLTHALMLDQSDERILTLENLAKQALHKLIMKFEKHLENPRAFGLSFAVDLKDMSLVSKLIERRFEVGLLYYPAGERTLRFRLNTAFKKSDIDNLFHSLNLIFDHIFNGSQLQLPSTFTTESADAKRHYQVSELLLKAKLGEISEIDFTGKIKELISTKSELEIIEINSKNYQDIRVQIEKLEADVYEPARQTDISHFDHAMKNRNGLAFALISNKDLKAIIFAAPLSEFPLERGLRLDPNFTDPDTLYMLDCTVCSEYQGAGLGLLLKALLTGVATLRGRSRIQGRNRDHLAASMLSINLELGAIEQNFIKEDYPDFETYRDVLYYSIGLAWPKTARLDLSSGQTRPASVVIPSSHRMGELLPVMVNKICLSNFVGQDFLDDVSELSQLIKPQLRHLYTTSGQSEACDKVAKTLWFNRDKEKFDAAPRFLSFKNNYFGTGSFLSRSLSQVGEPLFPVDIVDGIDELVKCLDSGHYLALYLEPLGQISGERFSLEKLKKIISLCHSKGVKVVFNETASFGYRADCEHFFLSSHPELDVDALMCYLGGQAGMAFTKEELFISAPLMMISTWDGDELSFALAADAATRLQDQRDQVKQVTQEFETKIRHALADYPVQIELQNGFGQVSGDLPLAWQRYFNKAVAPRTWVINPSYEMMKLFNKDHT